MKWLKNDGRFLNEKRPKFRQNARETAFSLAVFAPEDIEEYDLETAGVTGKDTNRNYKFNRSIDTLGSNGTDVRELDNR
jgi:hypothetical protein